MPLHRPFYISFYISICISTLPTQYTTFYVSLWRRAYAQNIRFYFLYRQYTNFLIVSICISTLPTQHTTFYVSLWRRASPGNVRLYFLYRQYINLFIFQFVSQHCLRSTLHFMFLSDEGTTLKTRFRFLYRHAVHQPFYISWFVSQPTENTTFVPLSDAMDNFLENSIYLLQITQ